MGGIATKQFRPLAPPAHFDRGSARDAFRELLFGDMPQHEIHI